MKTAGPHPLVSKLLNHAQANAIQDLELEDGKPPEATPRNLERLVQAVRDNVETQVSADMWRKLGVEDFEQLAPMTVTARLGNRLLGESPIVLEYSFVGTPLVGILVENATPTKNRA